MATRLVLGACPHDCPDTCAMHVTVEDGRATKVAGDPEHPITVGFLCGKVSNYLERVYSEDRILHPLVRENGGFRRASWEEALDVATEGLLRAGEQFGGESILPYSYMGTQGLIQGNIMSARLMNALGASNLERTICATAGYTGTAMAHGVSPEVDPRSGRTHATSLFGAGTRSPPRRTCGASCSTRASRVRGLWLSIPSGAGRRGWRTSTCAHCRAPTPRSPSG